MSKATPKTEKDIDNLIKDIKKKTRLNQEEIAEKIGYNRSYLSQAKKTDSGKLYIALYNGFKNELENITTKPAPAQRPVINYEALRNMENDPFAKALLNLSETDKNLSEANKINAKNIERLITLLEAKLQRMELSVKGMEGTRHIYEENQASPK